MSNRLTIYNDKDNAIIKFCDCPWVWDIKKQEIIVSDIVRGELKSYKCKDMSTLDNIDFCAWYNK